MLSLRTALGRRPLSSACGHALVTRTTLARSTPAALMGLGLAKPSALVQLQHPASSGLAIATSLPRTAGLSLLGRPNARGGLSSLQIVRSSFGGAGPLRSTVPAENRNVQYWSPYGPPRRGMRIENGGLVFPIPGTSTDFRIDWTFGLHFLWSCLQAAKFGTGAPLVSEAIRAASILAHEAAHAVAFRHYGAPVVEIGLHFAGGYAATNRELGPRADGVVSFAGPAANFAIAAGVAAAMLYFRQHGGLSLFWYSVGAEALSLNLLVGALNLLPMPPLDGSGVLRGLISFLPGRLSNPAFSNGLHASVGLATAAAVVGANHTWLGGDVFIDLICLFSVLASLSRFRG